MKLGTMKDRLAGALESADKVFCYAGASVQWEPGEALKALGEKAYCTHDFEALLSAILAEARSGDIVVCMSNGAFGGIHQKLLDGLKARAA